MICSNQGFNQVHIEIDYQLKCFQSSFMEKNFLLFFSYNSSFKFLRFEAIVMFSKFTVIINSENEQYHFIYYKAQALIYYSRIKHEFKVIDQDVKLVGLQTTICTNLQLHMHYDNHYQLHLKDAYIYVKDMSPKTFWL